jgi:hypothetical protein
MKRFIRWRVNLAIRLWNRLYPSESIKLIKESIPPKDYFQHKEYYKKILKGKINS